MSLTALPARNATFQRLDQPGQDTRVIALELPEETLIARKLLSHAHDDQPYLRRVGDRVIFTCDNCVAEYLVTAEHADSFPMPAYDCVRAARLSVRMKDGAEVEPRL